MVKISVVVSAFNEEKNIVDLMSSVSWADEIILVDNTSIDKTVELAKKFTSKIFTRPNNSMLNINKNYGFSKATSNWILSLDADERVTDQLKEEVKIVINASSANGYWLPRKNIIFDKWIKHGIWWPDYQLRLFRKGKGKFPEKHVHEYLEVAGKTAKLKNPLIHYNYTSVSQFIYKMDKIYTENEVENILRQNKPLYWYDAIRMPAADFLKTFFLQEGYKDGLHGLVLSILLAFYAEVTFAKVWERKGFKEYNDKAFLKKFRSEFKKTVKEFQFWFSKTDLKSTSNSLIKIVKKLKYKLINLTQTVH